MALALMLGMGRMIVMRAGWIVMVLIAGVSSAACVVNEAESPTRGVVVSGPPPAPMREDRPPPPNPQASWVAGYWHWTGMQYAWIPGHWEAPPSRAVVWSAPKVTSTPDGRYVYESGGWRPGPPENPGTPQTKALR